MKNSIELQKPPLDRAGIVQLKKAASCTDCEHISEAVGENCLKCSSSSFLCLARIPDRAEDERLNSNSSGGSSWSLKTS